VTVLPFLTMPAGDIAHPVPDLTGYITEGQIVLSPQVAAESVYPPVDLLGSLSRLMRTGAGTGRTRDDHLDVAAQGLAALARAQQARELADLVGEEALSETDRRYVAFATALHHEVIDQSPSENRPISETLDRLWTALALLPTRELSMVSAQQRRAHLPERPGERTAATS
jgi:V/A-type H+-transporting ATPase subunit B